MRPTTVWVVMAAALILCAGCAIRLEIEPVPPPRKPAKEPAARVEKVAKAERIEKAGKKETGAVEKRKAKFAIPEANLKIPPTLQMQQCAENLRRLYAALKKYEKDKGRLPNWLSDLVPTYLSREDLYCTNDPGHTSPSWAFPDPNLPCSYCYEYNPALTPRHWDPVGNIPMRENKDLQHRFFGDVLPLVRCFHHAGALNAAWNGQVYTSPIEFEKLFVANYTHAMLFANEAK